MTEHKIQTSINDFKPQISENGNNVFIVNQDKKNTCQILKDGDSIWSIDIQGDQVIAFPSQDYRNVVVYKIIDEIMFCEFYSIKQGLMFSYSFQNIKGIYSIYGDIISYMDSDHSNWIMMLDDKCDIRASFRTTGGAYDVCKIGDSTVYLEIYNNGIAKMVELVCNRNRYYIGINSICYMTVMNDHVVISLTPIKRSKKIIVYIFKFEDGTFEKKFEESFISQFTGYVYLSSDYRRLLIPLQVDQVTQLNRIDLRLNNINQSYNIMSANIINKVEGVNWIFNHNDDFKTIVGTSSNSQRVKILR